jgi:hypothetical protein
MKVHVTIVWKASASVNCHVVVVDQSFILPFRAEQSHQTAVFRARGKEIVAMSIIHPITAILVT